MLPMFTKKLSNIVNNYSCELCDYTCGNKTNYEKHLITRKHINAYECLQNNNIKIQKKYTCSICNKEYDFRQSLYRHKKTCKEPISQNDLSNNNLSNAEMSYLKNLVLEVVKNNTEIQKQNYELQKQNQEFQKQMFEICKNTNTNNYINTNSHNNNKTFNLQVFLNEECKDAMNMTEFINSIQVKLSDLENISNQGYIEGVSNILINHLNNTEMYKRPVHCSDAKRETLYVKEEDKWEKEGPDNKKMKRAVLGLEKKNFLMLNQWKEKYPKCMDSESTQSDAYMKMISKLMNGDEDNINKVIKKVAKEVVIEK